MIGGLVLVGVGDSARFARKKTVKSSVQGFVCWGVGKWNPVTLIYHAPKTELGMLFP